MLCFVFHFYSRSWHVHVTKMLIAEDLISSLVENMKLADVYGSLPFQWNNEQKYFELKSKSRLLIYKFRLYLSYIFVFLVFLQLEYVWKQINPFIKLHSIFTYSALLVNAYTHHTFCSQADLIVSYLNGMLDFEYNRNGKTTCVKMYTRI